MNGLFREAATEKGTFFRLQVYERVGILLYRNFSCSLATQSKVCKRIGKSVISVCVKAQKALQIIVWLGKSRENEARYKKGVSFFNRRYSKGIPFLYKMLYKARGLELGAEPPRKKRF